MAFGLPVYKLPTTGTRGSGAPTSSPMGTSTSGGKYAGMDPQAAFLAAVKDLNLTPAQLRASGTNAVADYLNQNGLPGWAGGGTKAADWISFNGAGFDVLPAGDANFQWLSDPASSTGSGGGPLGVPFGTPGQGGVTIPGLWAASQGQPTTQANLDPLGTLWQPGNIYGASTLQAQYAAARAQARAGAGGRQSTIFGGFKNVGAPATAPATLLGRAA